MNWHKSSYSGTNANCVEVAEGACTLVRDTQNRERGYLAFPADEWGAFLRAVNAEDR
ncbi:DUF397 domain-containing protein [Nocardiopsis chromatogenes]|uniref:DUF397 domain-containing protein n=1 Tax=Nocardiopsis chromatogenes TaxID=280239 RepID=UPI000348C6FC|nr:DUF397 domain-containing protein [Nocardiopsis chromatogenes]